MDDSVEAYLAAVPDDRKPVVETLHRLIVDLYPEVSVDMQYKMPTYHVGEAWVALANQKRYVSLYTCGYHHIADFKQKHPNTKTGKGCINFKPTEKLPLTDIRAVVRHAIDYPKG
jgi:uncharacterized protein YdhG (YjbR/CyaY superfamily)